MSKPLTDRNALVADASRGIIVGALLIVVLGVSFPAYAQRRLRGAWRTHWTVVPSVTVLVQADDSRVALVRESVVFWNQKFAEIGSPLRLGNVSTGNGAISATELEDAAPKVLRRNWSATPPLEITRWHRNIIVALSDGSFVSFAARW
jgi:hypothetical protein